MGSTQSKKAHKLQKQHQVKWTAERLQRDSIIAAIAANKRQRKLLMKQAKLTATSNKNEHSKYRSSQHSLLPPLTTNFERAPVQLPKGRRLKLSKSHQQISSADMSLANSSPLYYSPNVQQPTDTTSNNTTSPAPHFLSSKLGARHYEPYHNQHQHQHHHQTFHETVNYPIVGELYTTNGISYEDEEGVGTCSSQEEVGSYENYNTRIPAYVHNTNDVLYDNEDYNYGPNNVYNSQILQLAGGEDGKERNALRTNRRHQHRLLNRQRRHANRYHKHQLAVDSVLSVAEKIRNDLATPQFSPTTTTTTADQDALQFSKPNITNNKIVNNNRRSRETTSSYNVQDEVHEKHQQHSVAEKFYAQVGSLASVADKNLGTSASQLLPATSSSQAIAQQRQLHASTTELNAAVHRQPFSLEGAPSSDQKAALVAATKLSVKRGENDRNRKPSRHAIKSSSRALASSAAELHRLVEEAPQHQPYPFYRAEEIGEGDKSRNIKEKKGRIKEKGYNNIATKQLTREKQPPFGWGQEQYNDHNKNSRISRNKIEASYNNNNINNHQQNSHSSISLTYSSQSQLSTTSSSIFVSNVPIAQQLSQGTSQTNFIPESLYHLSEKQHYQYNNRKKTNNIMHHQNHQQNSATISFYHQLHHQSKIQKGLAYNQEERRAMNLDGLLPPAKQDLELQMKGVINFINNCQDELSKYIYLRNLKDFNERLFYSTLINNVELLMPLVYTPTVGLACQRFSEIYLRPRGIFLTINDQSKISQILNNWPEKDVRVIVVTDGERILGLGDLGANGMGISIGKLSLYTALAGIPPQNVLPITIDVGTNNEKNLNDPFYIGLRQHRIRGEKYDLLLEEFMNSVVDRWGRSCLIQFEDFANLTAFNLLQRYRNKYCTFNDDIQGTASVCLSGLISATSKLLNRCLSDSSYLFYGAGEANLGTANLLMMAMMEEGSISEQEARSKIWLVDSKGLVVTSRQDLNEHKRAFAQKVDVQLTNNLKDIIDYTKPLAIIGASAQGGAFTKEICSKMAQLNERPIIFALSNPTSKAECTASQAYEWTNGKCVFASGSPFDPVEFNGKTYVTGQGNNAYIFPAVGLAAIAAHVHTIPEDTFLIAAKALSDQLTEHDISIGLVYPKLNRIREVTLKVATRVLEHFYTERLATYRPEPDDKINFLRSIQYDCRYEAIEPIASSLGQMSLTNTPNSNRQQS